MVPDDPHRSVPDLQQIVPQVQPALLSDTDVHHALVYCVAVWEACCRAYRLDSVPPACGDSVQHSLERTARQGHQAACKMQAQVLGWLGGKKRGVIATAWSRCKDCLDTRLAQS